MDADPLLLPHLGAQARILLDRIVASGADGVDRRDTPEWVLSRLIDLRYVEESALDDTAFVCTPAGRHRWQIEILADSQRNAAALRRQLIRHRLDERCSRLGIDASTALTTAYSPSELRLHHCAPARSGPRPETKTRLASALATLFAAAAAALVVTFGSTEPQDVQDWLFPPTQHAAAAPVDTPKANAEQGSLVAAPVAATVTAPIDPPIAIADLAALVAAPVAATVTAPVDPPIAIAERAALVAAPVVATVTAPVDLHTEETPGRAVVSADATPALTRQSAAVSLDTIAPSDKHGYNGITYQPEQDVRIPEGTPAKVEDAGRAGSAVAHAASPDDGAIQNAAVAAAALIGSAVSESGRIATDLAAGVERGFMPIAAALLHAVADTERPVSARDAVTHQAHDDLPAPVAPATEPPSERGQPATLQPAIASDTVVDRAAVIRAAPDQRVTAKGPAARAGNADVDPQHAVVERLNLLSLSAARRGDAWRPNGTGGTAETGRPL